MKCPYPDKICKGDKWKSRSSCEYYFYDDCDELHSPFRCAFGRQNIHIYNPLTCKYKVNRKTNSCEEMKQHEE